MRLTDAESVTEAEAHSAPAKESLIDAGSLTDADARGPAATGAPLLA